MVNVLAGQDLGRVDPDREVFLGRATACPGLVAVEPTALENWSHYRDRCDRERATAQGLDVCEAWIPPSEMELFLTLPVVGLAEQLGPGQR